MKGAAEMGALLSESSSTGACVGSPELCAVAVSSFILPPSSFPQPLPEPRVPITIRPGTMEDIAFLDSLQKKTTKQVGWMPTKQFEGKVKAGHVLVAVGATHASPANVDARDPGDACVAPTRPVGYLIGNDQYFKRDDVGIIYQINVIPEMRRSLVAASLLKAQFERSAYGCRLYCCWCAQDIEANRFWESMGFVPLAFRAGSEKKSRVHIFWQKRIRSGDETTPWWFPSQTSGGSIREDRIVLPIPHGTHWSDAKPLVLPSADCRLANEEESRRSVLTTDHSPLTTRTPRASNRKSAIADRQSPPAAPKRAAITAGGLHFPLPAPAAPATPAVVVKRERKPKQKNDPRLVSAARELRDRWLEEVNAGNYQPASIGKYDVNRRLDSTPPRPAHAIPLLAA